MTMKSDEEKISGNKLSMKYDGGLSWGTGTTKMIWAIQRISNVVT